MADDICRRVIRVNEEIFNQFKSKCNDEVGMEHHNVINMFIQEVNEREFNKIKDFLKFLDLEIVLTNQKNDVKKSLKVPVEDLEKFEKAFSKIGLHYTKALRMFMNKFVQEDISTIRELLDMLEK